MMLGAAEVLVLASTVLGQPVEELVDTCDLAALERACAAQQGHEEQASPWRALAALVGALVTERPFPRGNDAIAVAAMATAASLRGYDLDLNGIAGIVDELRAGSLDEEAVAAWLKQRVRGDDEEAQMFERFTPRARGALVYAQQEAVGLGHRYIDTEHIVLGVAQVRDGIGAQALQQFGVSADSLRERLRERSETGSDLGGSGTPPFKPAAKKLLEQALATALAMGHHYIGTEHLLLAAFKVPEGLGADLLAGQGVTEQQATNAVAALLARAAAGASTPSAGAVASRAAVLEPIHALLDENDRMHIEIERLRVLLRRHGVDPDAGTASA